MGPMDHHGMAMPVRPWSAAYLLPVFAMWAVMMVAMMLPSAAPMILLHARIDRALERQPLGLVHLLAHRPEDRAEMLERLGRVRGDPVLRDPVLRDPVLRDPVPRDPVRGRRSGVRGAACRDRLRRVRNTDRHGGHLCFGRRVSRDTSTII